MKIYLLNIECKDTKSKAYSCTIKFIFVLLTQKLTETMRVLLVNTSENTGGAAVACQRLRKALMQNGVEVRMLTAPRRRGFLCKAIERFMMLPFVQFSWKKAWTVDVNWLGTDITCHEDFKWADVIHLHWVNQGMMSVAQIGKVAASGKRVVWTMHDLWPLSSIYHYPSNEQISSILEKNTMRRKLKAYASRQLRFVTCSRWLMHQAEGSELLQGNSICSIPNPIDTNIFHRADKAASRKRLGIASDAKLVLFVSQKLTDERKGARYFIDAANRMEGIEVAVLGGSGEEVAKELRARTHILGYITDQSKIADIYNAADVFVLPSLNDNLPNTIMESMACGVPCVGFRIGGIPEMIDHEKNGIVCEPRDVNALKAGIEYCLDEANHTRLSDACIEKVMQTYSNKAVAEKFMEIYS